MTTQEKINVMLAYDRGEKIQARAREGEIGHEQGWVDVFPNWDFYRCDFRVKPKFTPEQQAIIDAFNRGDEIQMNSVGNNKSEAGWISLFGHGSPSDFDFKVFDYRIKPREPREFCICYDEMDSFGFELMRANVYTKDQNVFPPRQKIRVREII